MAGRARRLAKAVAAVATSAAVEKAVRKAASDPRVRKKAAKVGAALKTRATSAGKTVAREAGKRISKQLAGPRKAAGKQLKRLGKLVAG
ncbi:MAG TPA: hypothetical protein VFP28_10220 [Gemmatimonadales bacterium]|nr:hypothetical protein [Gemmatimonadales bacterium]